MLAPAVQQCVLAYRRPKSLCVCVCAVVNCLLLLHFSSPSRNVSHLFSIPLLECFIIFTTTISKLFSGNLPTFSLIMIWVFTTFLGLQHLCNSYYSSSPLQVDKISWVASVGFAVGETDNYVLESAVEPSLSNGGTISVHVICSCL